MKHFRPFQKSDVLRLTRLRRFETKIGERIQCLAGVTGLEAGIQQSQTKYVIIGIPEDIGAKANMETGGADSNWEPFLSGFLNMQSNDFLSGEDILLLGCFDFSELDALIAQNAFNTGESVDAYRHAVNLIDEEVESLIKLVVSNGKVPLVIGGGHNNSYPLIKGTAKGLHKTGAISLAQINCINLDAYTGYRPMEGRHSGNPFRYADEDGYLQKYCAVGVHENYLQQNVWLDIVNNPFVDLITYEDIFLHRKRNFIQAVADATGFTDDTFTGVELDLDCIENTGPGGLSPCGISQLHARQYVNFAARHARVAYLHICAGASAFAETTGKLISYLVCDFIKAVTESTAESRLTGSSQQL